MSNRLDLLTALTAHLQGITPANGYTNDLSTSVFRGRQYFGTESPVPLVAINENPDDAESDHGRNTNKSRIDKWSLVVQGWVDSDSHQDNPTDPAYEMADEVERHLFRMITQIGPNPTHPESFKLGRKNIVSDIIINAPKVSGPDANLSSVSFFYIIVDFHILRTN